MDVVDHEQGFWFLLSQGNRLFLDVNCEHSAVSYDVLIELDEDESARYAQIGRSYLSELAEAINYSAPGVRRTHSLYKERNVSSKYQEEVLSAIEAWRSERTL